MHQSDLDLLELAGRLAKAGGVPAPRGLSPLAGGRNNRVFCVETDAEPVVLKCYYVDALDSRDRLAAEWRFIDYVWARGVRSVPRPLARDASTHAALYSFVEGRKLTPDEVDWPSVLAAANFICAANVRPRNTSALEPASEACFSLADHLATMRRRVARLATLDPDAPHRDEAAALVREVLAPAWSFVETSIVAAAQRDGIALDTPLSEAELIVSPSDFGFHNALASAQARLTFIDFEYAGRDDPAKLACDFFSCPEVPVPLKYWQPFLQALNDGIGLGSQFQRRAELLLDAYRVKWACILLNDFLPAGSSRRAFARPDDRAVRCRVQLGKAAAKLADIGQG